MVVSIKPHHGKQWNKQHKKLGNLNITIALYFKVWNMNLKHSHDKFEKANTNLEEIVWKFSTSFSKLDKSRNKQNTKIKQNKLAKN